MPLVTDTPWNPLIERVWREVVAAFARNDAATHTNKANSLIVLMFSSDLVSVVFIVWFIFS
jgi:hypothetical protein